MFVDFFIKRPIFATVCAIVIVLAGAICIPLLPVARYPNISPPHVSVHTNYIGANAATVESGVTTLLEQQINGTEGTKYISSSSGNDGSCSVDITFNLERNVDLAAVDVQSRVNAVQGRLPDEVKRDGISVNKADTSFVLAFGLGSLDNRYSREFLSNYADRYLIDALKRVKGVGDAQIFGARKYAMRIWLDPDKLARRGLTAQDVVKAVAEQNVQVPAGQIGQPPAPTGQTYQMSVRAVSRLLTPAEFENIVVKSGGGTLIRLRDIGRVELGSEDYGAVVRYRGGEAVGIGIMQRPGANAMEVADGVRAEMERLAKRFPPGLKYDIAFNTTRAVTESIHEVLWTLAQAIALVIIVIFVFLQEPRSTLIPAITIPVSLVGTFAFMKMFGFSVNTLTLFGITLATGLVVDDAIVVIENITRFVQEKKLNPQLAASEAMREVTGPIIAITLVLGAVFIPVAFFPGTTGQLYRQFALTIAFSVAISAFNALTLTPALSALWVKGDHQSQNVFFCKFNEGFDALRALFRKSLTFALRHKNVTLGLFVLSLGATYWLYQLVPSSFLPEEDTGWFMTMIQAPEGVSLEYTTGVLKKVEAVLAKENANIASCFGIAGWSFSGNTPNNAIVFANMRDWKERRAKGQSLSEVINRLRGPMSKITEAQVIPFTPPAIDGLGAFGGFEMELEDLSGTPDIAELAKSTAAFCRESNKLPAVRGVFSPFTASTPQLVVEVDRDKAKALQVNIGDIFSTLQIYLGSSYVNDFDMNNRVYRVYVQADQPFRANPRDIGSFYVRSANGQMISLANLVKVSRTVAAPEINHYNLFRSAAIHGSAAPGFSSGQAMKAMEELAQRVLPASMSFEWTGISLEQVQSGASAFIVFGLGLAFVFLVLAAQYESFADPFIILFSVPLAMLGALLAQYLRGLENDVFCQIGLVMLIGLASKNAILIVEFANHLKDGGLSATEAVIRATEIRLRPILMTSLAFVMGILPLVFAAGAGAGARHSLGTAVCGGMVVSTILSLFVVPVVYVTIASLQRKKTPPPPGGQSADFAPDAIPVVLPNQLGGISTTKP